MERKKKAEIIFRRLAANEVFKKKCNNEGTLLLIEETMKEIEEKQNQ